MNTVEYKIKPPTLRVGGLILYCGGGAKRSGRSIKLRPKEVGVI